MSNLYYSFGLIFFCVIAYVYIQRTKNGKSWRDIFIVVARYSLIVIAIVILIKYFFKKH